MDNDLIQLGFSLFTVVGGGFAAVVWWLGRHSAPVKCPNCHTEKAFRRVQSQTLAALGTGGPKGGRQQVIERFSCSTCGYTLSKNRLEPTQTNTSTGA